MKKVISTILVILVLIGLWFLISGLDDQKNTGNNNDGENVSSQQYTNNKFSFSLEHPSNWQSSESEGGVSAKFNFYPISTQEEVDSSASVNFPLDNLVNQTHVSVYPEGIPSEGVFAQSISVEESGIDFSYQLSEDSRVYVLENGDPFAAYLKPASSPDSWNRSGFVFIRVKVDGLEVRCERGGQTVSESECDPLALDDEVIWNGDVDRGIWVDTVGIAESFEFTSEITDKKPSDGNFAQNEDIVVTNPKPNQVISSPLELKGEARGTWLFEANSSVVLTDWDGRIIAESYIETDENWMTTEFVPFSGRIEFDLPEDIGDYSDRGSIIFRKANPSGLPENDDALEFTVMFR